MKLIWYMFMAFVLALMLGSIIRNTTWMKERNKRIWGWFCHETGGSEFTMEGNWIFSCTYKVDKRGKVIRP
jgi:hypothetical protein